MIAFWEFEYVKFDMEEMDIFLDDVQFYSCRSEFFFSESTNSCLMLKEKFFPLTAGKHLTLS